MSQCIQASDGLQQTSMAFSIIHESPKISFSLSLAGFYFLFDKI